MFFFFMNYKLLNDEIKIRGGKWYYNLRLIYKVCNWFGSKSLKDE